MVSTGGRWRGPPLPVPSKAVEVQLDHHEPDLSHLPVGRRVAYWRTRHGMSQQVLADLLGKSKSWLDKVERGERGLDKLSVLCAIAAVLHIDVPLLLSQRVGPVPAVAPHQRVVATTKLRNARREVDRLLRRHIGPAAASDRHPAPLPQVLTWVYAALVVEAVEPSQRDRVIAAVCTWYRSQHDHPRSVPDGQQPRPN